jgi:hypothetical protein
VCFANALILLPLMYYTAEDISANGRENSQFCVVCERGFLTAAPDNQRLKFFRFKCESCGHIKWPDMRQFAWVNLGGVLT